jgi:hypothetical protein
VSAIDAAMATIDRIGAEGELDANVADPIGLDVEAVPDPIHLPDGRDVYMPTVRGTPLDDIVCGLIDDNPAKSRFLRLIGPPGVGKSAVSRALAWRLWREHWRGLDERDGVPSYGFGEIFGSPSSDEYSPFR